MGIFKELATKKADRAGEFFGRPAEMVAAVAPDTPAVEEPTKPRHTCKQERGTTLKVYADHSDGSPWWKYDPTCPACVYKRTQRGYNQLKHEQQDKTIYGLKVDAADWPKIRERWKKREGAVYCAFPLEDGNFGVLHNQAKEAGDNLDQAAYADSFSLMQSWVVTPEGKRVQTSQGWGGPWNGWKGNTAAKQERAAAEKEAAEKGETLPPVVVLKVKASPAAVARHFGVELKRGRRLTINQSWYDVYTGLLELVGKDMETIDGQPVLPALLNTFVEFGKQQDTAAATIEKPSTRPPATQPGLWTADKEKEHEGVKKPEPEPAPIHLVSWLNKGASYVGTG